jgi:NAD(P)H-dependent flavin oxidoreductase YrpB (nitropropane dioxygenase family)
MPLPTIIQGGMGAGVSAWSLARAVSQLGQLGVVSGTALETIVAKRLQLGDLGGHMRRALDHFPVPGVVNRILDRYFKPEGKLAAKTYLLPRPFSVPCDPALLELTVAANFVEVYLAKEGHGGLVGINFLEKIQLPTLPSIFGAMLAGVDYILMGAGIPRSIPGVLDRLAAGETAELRMNVSGQTAGKEVMLEFNPTEFFQGKAPTLKRPQFLAIVSSSVLATTLARKSNGKVDGFVVEGPSAGGHNAPPRGPMQLSVKGEPVYGRRDVPDLEQIRGLGLPFWLAGGFGHPGKLQEALAAGATGVQVGTPFAFCEESDLDGVLKQRVIEQAKTGRTAVLADPLASPTGFPFQVVQLEGSLSDAEPYEERPRLCDIGALREWYETPDGKLDFRCAAEPVEAYVRKGGSAANTVGRKCLCNALHANIGLGQLRPNGKAELPLVTAGAELGEIARFLEGDRTSYRAADVIQYILGDAEAEKENSGACATVSAALV